MARKTSFYYAFLVLPSDQRRAIIAVWDFCRVVDDAVDEVVPESARRGGLTAEARALAATRVAEWREELAFIYTGSPRTAQGRNLQPFVRESAHSTRRAETLLTDPWLARWKRRSSRLLESPPF